MQHMAVLAIVFMGMGHSSAGENIKERSFVLTYPSNTFPLPITGARHTTPSTNIKDAIEQIELKEIRSNSLIDEKVTNISIGEREDLNVSINEKEKDIEENNMKERELSQNEVAKDPKRSYKALLHRFPFKKQEQATNIDVRIHRHKSSNNIINERATDLLDELSAVAPDAKGRKCIDKVMMREETEYDEVLTCDHSYDERCHTSYVTKYHPHQEEQCDEKFRKVCTIEYEQKAVHEVVEVCITPLVKDCDIEGPEVCQTVYESVCSTVQKSHNVTDDVAECRTVEEKHCEEVIEGYKTVMKCDTWPMEKCSLDTKEVEKFSPVTSCEKVAREMCSPPGCGIKEVIPVPS